MIAKFQIEYLLSIKDKVYVFAKYITEDVNFYLSDSSYSGECPIEKWMEIPRAHDDDGNLRNDLFAFVLKDGNDRNKIIKGEIVELWDDYVEVMESFKMSDGRIIVFLKCYPGKLENRLKLMDDTYRLWLLKQYLVITGSFETFEKIKKEEKENIFQYLLEPINHTEKPLKGAKLKVLKGDA